MTPEEEQERLDGFREQHGLKKSKSALIKRNPKALGALLDRTTDAMIMADRSMYIRIGTSTLYDMVPGYARPLLREIAFMASTSEKRPTGTPYEDYEGWTWATQNYLAERVGCSRVTVNRLVAQFEADGLIETRGWTDLYGHPHVEYKIIEEAVDAAQRVEGQPRPKRPTSRVYKANAGSFKKGADDRRYSTPKSSAPSSAVSSASVKTHVSAQPEPSITSPRALVSAQPEPMYHASQSALAEMPQKGVDLVRGFVRDVSAQHSTSPSASLRVSSTAAPSTQHHDQNQKQNRGGSPPTPPVVGKRETKAKPTPAATSDPKPLGACVNCFRPGELTLKRKDGDFDLCHKCYDSEQWQKRKLETFSEELAEAEKAARA